MRTNTSLATLSFLLGAAFASPAGAQEILPFPTMRSASTAGPTLQESVYQPRVQPKHLPPDAPNIIIVLIDDVGPAQCDTYGGEFHTPRCRGLPGKASPIIDFTPRPWSADARCALTGETSSCRSGQIAELGNDWDGTQASCPKTSATVAEVLKDYGYSTAAFGKWHNTSCRANNRRGPLRIRPTGYGFEYFYGFLAGEASQYEPNLMRNTSIAHPPKTSGGHDYYHLSEDLPTTLSAGCKTTNRSSRTSPSLCIGPAARRMDRIRSRRNGRTDIKANLMTAGINTASAFQRQRRWAGFRRMPAYASRPDTLPSWDAIRRVNALPAAADGIFRGNDRAR